MAQSRHDSELLLEAHFALGVALFYLGELAPARTYLEQGIALYDSQQHHSLAFTYGLDPGVACLCNTTLALWVLGYPEQALKRSLEALTLAHELSHPFSLAFALDFSAMLHQYRREGHAVQDRSEAVMALSTEQGFPLFSAMGTILRGGALAEQGHGAEDIIQMREGLAALQATGTEVWRSHLLAVLAEAYRKDAQIEAGLTTVAEALAFVERTEGRYYEAELYRLQGELTLQESKVESQRSQVEEEAEACFQKAIAIAQKQEAKFWELRAATSLARLW